MSLIINGIGSKAAATLNGIAEDLEKARKSRRRSLADNQAIGQAKIQNTIDFMSRICADGAPPESEIKDIMVALNRASLIAWGSEASMQSSSNYRALAKVVNDLYDRTAVIGSTPPAMRDRRHHSHDFDKAPGSVDDVRIGSTPATGIDRSTKLPHDRVAAGGD